MFEEQLFFELKRFCRSICRDVDEAEDVALEAFKRMFRRLEDEQEPLEITADKLLPYLKITARNAYYERLRAQPKSGEPDQLDESEHGTIIDERSNLVSELERKDFWKLVSARLNPIEFQVIQLKYLSGLTFPEIAIAVGLSERQIKYKHITALRKLSHEGNLLNAIR